MSRPGSIETASSVARLRAIILVDIGTALAATVLMIVVRLTVVSSSYLTLAAVLVALSGVVMAAGLRPLGRGDVGRALRWLAAANWSIAIAAATIATFCWPLMMLTALLPSVLAASLITGKELTFYVVTSVVVSLAVVLVGLLQDFSGLSEDVPEWDSRCCADLLRPHAGCSRRLDGAAEQRPRAGCAGRRHGVAIRTCRAGRRVATLTSPGGRGDRPRATADRARPARRRPAAIDRHRHRAVSGEGSSASSTARLPPACSIRCATNCASPTTSCAISPRASTRPCSRNMVWRQRCNLLPIAARSQ